MTAVGMFFMPESPAFLLSKGKEEEAKKALQWLRGNGYDITKEIEQVFIKQLELTWNENSILFSVPPIDEGGSERTERDRNR